MNKCIVIKVILIIKPEINFLKIQIKLKQLLSFTTIVKQHVLSDLRV